VNDYAEGKIGSVDDLPTVTRWNDEFFGPSGKNGSIPKGKGAADAVEVHHAVEKFIMTKLGLVETDNVPGIVLKKLSGQPNGHAALQGKLRAAMSGLSNSDDIVRAMRTVYQSQDDWKNIWPAAQAWLQKSGISIPD
jgi:hypothetical protein